MHNDHPYVSEIRIIRSAGPDREAILPTGESVTFGVHGGIAKHYGVAVAGNKERAATLDYVVAAVAAAMVGTFARTLHDEGVTLGEGDLQAETRGIFRSDDGELVLSEIEVAYLLRLTGGIEPDNLQRAHDRHLPMCPLVKALGTCIEIRTDFSLASAHD